MILLAAVTFSWGWRIWALILSPSPEPNHALWCGGLSIRPRERRIYWHTSPQLWCLVYRGRRKAIKLNQANEFYWPSKSHNRSGQLVSQRKSRNNCECTKTVFFFTSVLKYLEQLHNFLSGILHINNASNCKHQACYSNDLFITKFTKKLLQSTIFLMQLASPQCHSESLEIYSVNLFQKKLF